MKEYLKEVRITCWFAMPFILNQILQMFVVTVDSIMAGNDSDLTLAAVSQGSSIYTFVILIQIGLLMPLLPLFAKLHAKHSSSELKILFQQSFWIAIPLGIICFVIMRLLPNVFYSIDIAPEIIPPATSYIHIVSYSVPIIALLLPMKYFVEGIGKPIVVMYVTAASIPINIIGNYIFINGMFGLPKMGASGIAISTLISQVYIFVVVVFYLRKNSFIRSLELFNNFLLPRWQSLKLILAIGLPSASMLILETGMFTTVVLLSGKFGVIDSAANQIALNYVSNMYMIPLGISMALAARIGAAMANDNMREVKVIGLSGIALGALFMMFSGIIIFMFGHQIAELYTDNTQIVNVAFSILMVAIFFQVFDGIQVCVSGVLRGMEETKSPMYFAAIGFWLLGIPMGVILAFTFDFGVTGLWWGLVIGLAVSSLLCLQKFISLTTVKTVVK